MIPACPTCNEDIDLCPHNPRGQGPEMSDIKYEPTREHWTPYEHWMRDVLTDDARVSWLDDDYEETRSMWGLARIWYDDAARAFDVKVHPDDVPERPAEEHPDEALAQAIADAFYEGDSYDAARAAREHIEDSLKVYYRDLYEKAEAEVLRLQGLSLGDLRRKVQAEAERDEWKAETEDSARRETTQRNRADAWEAHSTRWQARHAALVADIEAVRVRWHERYMSMPDGHTTKRYAEVIEDFSDELNRTIDSDDERGQAEADRDLLGGSGANAIERGCGEDFRRRFVDPAPDTVTLRRDDAEDLLYCWSVEPDFSDAERAVTARVRAALGWGDDSE